MSNQAEEQPPQVCVPSQRLARLHEAVTRAQEGAFDEAMSMLSSGEDSPLSDIEQVLRSFIKDYKIAVEQSAISIDEFNTTRRELERKIAMIEQQRQAILTLSAPIIDIWDGIVTVPLTGDLDRARMSELMERLLVRIQSSRTSWVLLDLTGSGQINAEVGTSLLRLSSAIRLMGSDCLLTGIGESLARTLVQIGAPMAGIRSIASLRDGLMFCMAHPRAAGAPRGVDDARSDRPGASLPGGSMFQGRGERR